MARERRLLQAVVAFFCLSPLVFGGLGMLRGAAMAGEAGPALDSHFRYLSGIFFGLGVMALSCVPSIERKGERFGWVALMVVIGGAARLLGFVVAGLPQGAMFWAIFAELVATPLLWVWQRRVARRYSGLGSPG
jgi:hypothetical protein